MPPDNRVRIVEATPVSHAPDHTRFDIPSWGITYPITVYRMEPQQQRMLPLNQTQVMLMLARSLKQGKSADLRENWNWQFVRLATEEEAAEYYRKNPPVKRPEVKMTGPAGMSPNEAYRHLSIQRQTALKLAVKQVHKSAEDPKVEDVIEVADRFAAWIEGGIIGGYAEPHSEPEPAAEKPEADTEQCAEWAIPNAESPDHEPEAGPEDQDIIMIPEEDDSPAPFLAEAEITKTVSEGQKPQAQKTAAPAAAENTRAEDYQGDPSETEWMQE